MMNRCYIAYVGQENDWWIGWVQGIRGVNCQERTREALIGSLKTILIEMLDYEQPKIEQKKKNGFKMVIIKEQDLYNEHKPHSYEFWSNPDGTKMTSIPHHGEEEEIVPSIIEWICRDLEVEIPLDDE